MGFNLWTEKYIRIFMVLWRFVILIKTNNVLFFKNKYDDAKGNEPQQHTNYKKMSLSSVSP